MKEFKITMVTNDGEEVGAFFIPDKCIPSGMSYEDFVKQFEDPRKIISLNTSAIKAGIYPRFLGVGMAGQEDELIDCVRSGHLPFDVYLEVTTNPVMIQAREKMKEYQANLLSGNYGAVQGATITPAEETFVDRLYREKNDLDDKLEKLRDFMDSEKYHEIPEKQQKYLNMQEAHMSGYVDVLVMRINDIEIEDDLLEGEIDYDELAAKFKKDDLIISLKTGKPTIYSGHLTIVGVGMKQIGYDSFNEDLVLYKEGKIAKLSGAVKGEESKVQCGDPE